MVSTQDSESCDPSSNLDETCLSFYACSFIFIFYVYVFNFCSSLGKTPWRTVPEWSTEGSGVNHQPRSGVDPPGREHVDGEGQVATARQWSGLCPLEGDAEEHEQAERPLASVRHECGHGTNGKFLIILIHRPREIRRTWLWAELEKKSMF